MLLKSPKKHILIVSSEFPPQPGGIGNHAYNLAKHLQSRAYEVTVIADNRSFSGEEETNFDTALDYTVHRIKREKRRVLMYLKRLLLLWSCLKTSDVVIASGKFSLWSVAFSSLFFRKKYIGVIHGTEVNFKHKALKYSIDKALKRFSKIIAVSHYTKSLIAHINHPDVSVIPNGYEGSKWDAIDLEAVKMKGFPKLITVGNVTSRKGQLNVIKHLPDLLLSYPEIHYHCAGLPTQKDEFMAVAENLGVQDCITFHGRISDVRLKTLLSASDVFVMLSSPTDTGDVEGFGIAVLEANALGIPAIGAKDCGIEDAIANETSGILVPYHDTPAFLEALTHILSHQESYKFGAKQWALQHTWDIIIKRYQSIIEA